MVVVGKEDIPVAQIDSHLQSIVQSHGEMRQIEGASDGKICPPGLHEVLVDVDHKSGLDNLGVAVVAEVFEGHCWKHQAEAVADFCADYHRGSQVGQSARTVAQVAATYPPHRPLPRTHSHRTNSPPTHIQLVENTAWEVVVKDTVAAQAERPSVLASVVVVLSADQTYSAHLTVEDDGHPRVACRNPGCHEVGHGRSTGNSWTAIGCSESLKRMNRVGG